MVSATAICNVNIMASKRAGAVSLVRVAEPHQPMAWHRKELDGSGTYESKAGVPALPSRSLYVAINTSSTQIWQDKNKQKLFCVTFLQKKDKSISCLCGVPLVVSPNSPFPPAWTGELCPRAMCIKMDLQEFAKKKNAAFQWHPVHFYFKGKILRG